MEIYLSLIEQFGTDKWDMVFIKLLIPALNHGHPDVRQQAIDLIVKLN